MTEIQTAIILKLDVTAEHDYHVILFNKQIFDKTNTFSRTRPGDRIIWSR